VYRKLKKINPKMNGTLMDSYVCNWGLEDCDWTENDEYFEKHGFNYKYFKEFNDNDIINKNDWINGEISGGCGKNDLLELSLIGNDWKDGNEFNQENYFELELNSIGFDENYQEVTKPVVVIPKQTKPKVQGKSRKSKKRKRDQNQDEEEEEDRPQKKKRKKRKDFGKKHKSKGPRGKRTLIMAEAVLRQNGGRKMKIKDILARGRQISQVMKLKVPGGNTPERTMARDVYQDAKNPDSIFVVFYGERAAALKTAQ
jgi:hypothetical protein